MIRVLPVLLGSALAAPLLGPDGPLVLGPLTGPPPAVDPAAGRGHVGVDPQDGSLVVSVVDLVIPGEPDPFVLGRAWSDDGWEWLGLDRVFEDPAGARLVAPGRDSERLEAPRPRTTGAWPVGTRLTGQGHRTLERTADGWILDRGSGCTEAFDPDGRMLARDGCPEALLRAEWREGALVALALPDGRRVGFTDAPAPEAGGLVRRARGPAGLEARYEEQGGRLTLARTAAGVQHRYLYDRAGRIQTILWPDGARCLVARDPDGRVADLSGPGPARWRFAWGPEGLETAWDGRESPWKVDRQPGVVAVTDPSGRTARLEHDQARVTGWVDPAGGRTRVLRDPSGTITGIEAPGPERWALRLGATGHVVETTDPAGQPWRVDRDAMGRVVRRVGPDGRIVRWLRDAGGAVVEILQGDERVRLGRDGAGRLVDVRVGAGPATRVERDAAGRIAAVQDPSGGRTILAGRRSILPGTATGPDGQVWAFSVGSLGLPVGLEVPGGVRLEWRCGPSGALAEVHRGSARTRVSTDADGRPTRVEDAFGRVTGWTWDRAGRLVAWLGGDGSRLDVGRDARGDVTSLAWEDVRLALLRDAQGRLRAIAHEAGDRLLAVGRDARGAVVEMTWKTGRLGLGRDAARRVERVVLGDREWRLEHDAAARLVGVVEGSERWVLERDPGGLVAAVEGPDLAWRLDRGPCGGVDRFEAGGLALRFGRSASGQVLRISGPSGAVLGLDRDPAGRPVTVRFPDGELLRIRQAGASVALAWEDARGHATGDVRLEVDASGRLVSVQDGSQERRYRYGPRDEVVAVEEGDGAWSLLPGLLETPTGAQLPLATGGPAQDGLVPGPVAAWGLAGTKVAWRRDPDGGLLGVEGEAGAVRLTHDPLGRLLEVVFQAAGEPDRTWCLDWDPLGGLRSVGSPEGRTDVVTALGGIRVLSDGKRRAVVLDGPYGTRVIAGPEGRVSLSGDGLLGPGGRIGEPRVRSAPGGLPDGIVPGPFGAFGRFQLFCGGPLVGPQDALDPVTGQPTGAPPVRWPWSPTGWPRPDVPLLWPEPDGVAQVAWDPEAWSPEQPWASPLAILVALGEIEPEAPTFQAEDPVAPLPWLPAGLADPPPGWPLAVDPVTAVFLRAAIRPCRPVSEAALLDALLGDLVAALPRPVPGLPWPAGLPQP
ncbi:MAG: hypothetical protein JXB39_03980 [Deltaproteobacteria bacterium]|nr:hypothetical protein [Deltaproteobacteria bacterium]